MKFMCWLFGHERDRGHVWDDNLNYRANCRRCAAPMIRPTVSRRWRLYDPATDNDPARRPSRKGGSPTR